MTSMAGFCKKAAVPVLFILAASFGNAAASMANMAIASPFFFDSVFTAICGALLGPIAGLSCGLVSHLFMELFHGWNGMFIPFAPCNMATGFIVGLFARGGRFSTLSEAMLCSLLVSLANAVIGALVAYFLFGGIASHASDYLVTGLLLAGLSRFLASFLARIPVNLIDKGIAVSAAFFIARNRRKLVPPC
jgi:energy-coupling factor transport system substrate-specific component